MAFHSGEDAPPIRVSTRHLWYKRPQSFLSPFQILQNSLYLQVHLNPNSFQLKYMASDFVAQPHRIHIIFMRYTFIITFPQVHHNPKSFQCIVLSWWPHILLAKLTAFTSSSNHITFKYTTSKSVFNSKYTASNSPHSHHLHAQKREGTVGVKTWEKNSWNRREIINFVCFLLNLRNVSFIIFLWVPLDTWAWFAIGTYGKVHKVWS